MNYNEIMVQIESLQHHARHMRVKEPENPIWQQDVEALEEVKDMLHDYQQQGKQLQMMIRKYEKPSKPIRSGRDLYICSECGHRVNPAHSHCHRCGNMLAREVPKRGTR